MAIPGSSTPPERRRFLRILVGGSAAVIAAITAIPGIGLLLAPVLSRSRGRKHKVIFQNPADLRSTSFVAARYEGQEETAPGIFVRLAGPQHVVLYSRCTHAACSVTWQPAEKKFVCPCHGGRFDVNGTNISGPPPRPLERLAASMQGGELFVEEPEA